MAFGDVGLGPQRANTKAKGWCSRTGHVASILCVPVPLLYLSHSSKPALLTPRHARSCSSPCFPEASKFGV